MQLQKDQADLSLPGLGSIGKDLLFSGLVKDADSALAKDDWSLPARDSDEKK